MKKRMIKNSLVAVMTFMATSSVVSAEMAPDFKQETSLAIELVHHDTKLLGEVLVYRVANMEQLTNGTIDFKVLPAYQSVHQKLDNLTAQEQIQYAKDFANNASSNTFVAEVASDENGMCRLNEKNLTAGMYLVIPKVASHYEIEPFLVSVPSYLNLEDDYIWQYDVICQPKSGNKTKKPENPENPEKPEPIDPIGPFDPDFPETGGEIEYPDLPDNRPEPDPDLPETTGDKKDDNLPQTGTAKGYGEYVGMVFLTIMIGLLKLRKAK